MRARARNPDDKGSLSQEETIGHSRRFPWNYRLQYAIPGHLIEVKKAEQAFMTGCEAVRTDLNKAAQTSIFSLSLAA